MLHLPQEIVEYIVMRSHNIHVSTYIIASVLRQVCATLRRRLKDFGTCKRITYVEFLRYVSTYGYVGLLRWYYATHHPPYGDANAYVLASYYGHDDVLTWMETHAKAPHRYIEGLKLCARAARGDIDDIGACEHEGVLSYALLLAIANGHTNVVISHCDHISRNSEFESLDMACAPIEVAKMLGETADLRVA